MKKPKKSNKSIKQYIQESVQKKLNEWRKEYITLYYIKDSKGVTGIYTDPEVAKTAKSKHDVYFKPKRGVGIILTKDVLEKDYQDGKINTSNIDTISSPPLDEISFNAPAKPTTAPPPTTTPVKRPNPIKIPRPGQFPKPAPKAYKQTKEQFLESWIKLERVVNEKKRMNRLIQEAPMEIEPGQDQPDDSIRSGIEGRSETPFSAIELFSKTRLNQTAIEKIGSEEFNGIVRHLATTRRLNMQEIFNVLNMIVRYEMPHRNALQDLSKNIVQRKFGLSDEIMDMINPELKNPGQIEAPDTDNDTPEEEAEEHFTPEELEIIKKHTDKRIIHNTLMMGAGYRAHKIFDELKNALDGIDPRLYPLYNSIMPNVELFMWKMPVEEMYGARQMWGRCDIVDDNEQQDDGEEQGEGEEKEVSCQAQAIIFPVLLHEVAKGAVEILFLQHLADVQEKYGEAVAKKVVKNADSYYSEHWLKLIGPQLWKYLHDALTFVVNEENEDYGIIAYVLNRMASMEPEVFVSILDDTIHDGPQAIEKIRRIVSQVRNDIEAYENQNNEQPTPEDITPAQEDNSDEIANLLAQTQDQLLNTPENERPQPKKLEDMEVDELNNELQTALDLEDYDRAVQIRDILNAR